MIIMYIKKVHTHEDIQIYKRVRNEILQVYCWLKLNTNQTSCPLVLLCQGQFNYVASLLPKPKPKCVLILAPSPVVSTQQLCVKWLTEMSKMANILISGVRMFSVMM